MSKHPKNAITPTRSENYPEWYQQVIHAAEMAEHAPVRGCMIIKPWGYAIWERMQSLLDEKIKELGHENIYCPLFIPLEFLEKEAEHVSGFAKECAVVTHSKLVMEQGQLIPAGELDKPLVVRPTSEMMIGELYAKWIQSYRDLPLLLNQWANIVRWEMRTRLFLRTSEFLWQEGHTAHSSAEQAREHSLTMQNMYIDFCQQALAIPCISGEKSENERFPGAVTTYTLEALMQDNKALQLATSHFLGQNFAKASNIQYQNENGQMQHVWTTSWGITTRMIGALIMSHSDDDGLILPPQVAAKQVVILPILRKGQDHDKILAHCERVADILKQTVYAAAPLRVHIDRSDKSGGEKIWSWIKKGVPIRLEIGAQECSDNSVCLAARHQSHRDKQRISLDQLATTITSQLTATQETLWQRAQQRLEDSIEFCNNPTELDDFFGNKSGMAAVYWCEDNTQEQKLQQDHGVSIRCFVDEQSALKLPLQGPCVHDSKKTGRLALLAKAY